MFDVKERYDTRYCYQDLDTSPEWIKTHKDVIKFPDQNICFVPETVLGIKSFPWAIEEIKSHWSLVYANQDTFLTKGKPELTGQAARYILDFLEPNDDDCSVGWEEVEVGIDEFCENFDPEVHIVADRSIMRNCWVCYVDKQFIKSYDDFKVFDNRLGAQLFADEMNNQLGMSGLWGITRADLFMVPCREELNSESKIVKYRHIWEDWDGQI